MLIIDQKLSNITEQNFKDILLLEISQKLGIKKHFNSKMLCRKIQEQCDGKAFLDSKNLRYPIVNPKTCNIDCKILLNSYYELKKSSKSPGIMDMIQEAENLLSKNNCSKNVKVKFEDFEMELDALLFYID